MQAVTEEAQEAVMMLELVDSGAETVCVILAKGYLGYLRLLSSFEIGDGPVCNIELPLLIR